MTLDEAKDLAARPTNGSEAPESQRAQAALVLMAAILEEIEESNSYLKYFDENGLTVYVK